MPKLIKFQDEKILYANLNLNNLCIISDIHIPVSFLPTVFSKALYIDSAGMQPTARFFLRLDHSRVNIQ